uniref:Uncharacterized protein n=1 Tax=Rhizophora mucronata TaxID=61149 RepID=A0A2P2PM77_RHIMU
MLPLYSIGWKYFHGLKMGYMHHVMLTYLMGVWFTG